MFKNGINESLLHVPAFVSIGTKAKPVNKPVLLLSFENKLDKDKQVIIAKEGMTKIYNPYDEIEAKKLAEEFKERLLPDMKLLDMIIS